MLAIRLQRMGKKNRPHYRLVVSEAKRDLYGKHLEILGHYDPVSKPKTVKLEAERIKHWLSVGAKASATVHNILVTEKVIEDKKVKAWQPKKKPATAGEGDETPAAVASAKEEASAQAEAPKSE